MRKPAKPRKPEKPTRESVAKKLGKEHRIAIKGAPTFAQIMEMLPPHARDPSKVRFIGTDQYSYGYRHFNKNQRQTIYLKIDADPATISKELEKEQEKYAEKLPRFEEKWKAYEKKLMEWKEWKYAKVMKEINEA
jgi:hypothetical protein